eukprot:959202-Amphidinium_carterae.1
MNNHKCKPPSQHCLTSSWITSSHKIVDGMVGVSDLVDCGCAPKYEPNTPRPALLHCKVTSS